MKLDEKSLRSLEELIKNAQNILIIPHKNPDGDAMGSALGLYQVFTLMGKNAEVVCFDPPPPAFAFMPNAEQVKTELPPLKHDAIFIVDSGATHLTGFHESHPELFDKSLPVVNIDHHASNEFYGKINLVDPEAPSATVLIHDMIGALEWPLDRLTATCLLTGIYTDTGSFMHSNTDAEVLRIAAHLLSRGADLRSISKDIFHTTKVSTLHLWGRVLKNIHQTPEGVTMSVVRQNDFHTVGADYSEMTGVVDYVNSVPGSPYSVILSERDGKVKGSLRTLREDVDVAAVASAYGGGGHVKAAGFTLTGKLEKEVRWKVVDK